MFTKTSAEYGQPLEYQSRAAMEHYEVANIPAGSLYPLATGILDYYVVECLRTEDRPNKPLVRT